MALHTYFPPQGPDVSTADVIVKCIANGSELPAHRRNLAALSKSLEAAVVQFELGQDKDASDLVEDLVGSDEDSKRQTQLPVLFLQSTSEESIRLLLGHAYGIEIANRLCVKTASEVALVAKKYDIPVLFHKVDAFLAKAMDGRTTDRLRCKPMFWAEHRDGVTDSALRFLVFAEQAELALMQRATMNLVAHIVVLDDEMFVRERPLSPQVAAASWGMIKERVKKLEAVIAAGPPVGSGAASPRSPFSLSSCPSSSVASPIDSPRSSSPAGHPSPAHPAASEAQSRGGASVPQRPHQPQRRPPVPRPHPGLVPAPYGHPGYGYAHAAYPMGYLYQPGFCYPPHYFSQPQALAYPVAGRIC